MLSFVCPNGHRWQAVEATLCPVCGSSVTAAPLNSMQRIQATLDLPGAAPTANPRPGVATAPGGDAASSEAPAESGEATTTRALPEAAASRSAAAGGPGHPVGYEILGELGHGGMGVVYKAKQVKANRLVALKMILARAHASLEQKVRFQIEAEAVARLQHPNIVQLHEVGEHDDLPFFSLEFCAGGSHDRKLHGQPLPGPEAAALLETLARAMHYAHSRGVVHRDLKPANVLLTDAGQPKITDFGLAKRIDEGSNVSQAGTLIGTPSYMAPEQAEGRTNQIGPATDVWALGAILYELLTGRPPFLASTAMETVLQVMRDEPVPPRRLNPRAPRDLDIICLKCLKKDPARRYADAGALADDLARFREGRPLLARPASAWERSWKWTRRHPTAAALAAVVILATTVLLSLGVWFNARLAQRHQENVQLEKRLGEEQDKLTASAEAIRLANDEASTKARQAEAADYVAGIHAAWQAFERNDVARTTEKLDGCPAGRRRWEWGYLQGLCHTDRFTFMADEHGAHCAAVSSEGALLAVGIGDPYQLDADGKRNADGKVMVYPLLGGRRGQTLSLPKRSGPVSDVAVSADRTFLAAASLRENLRAAVDQRFDPPDGLIVLWKLNGLNATGQPEFFEGYGCVAFSHDGRLLAYPGNADHAIHLWDVEQKKELPALPPQGGFVRRVTFGPGGLLASTSVRIIPERDGRPRVQSQLRIWNLTTGKKAWSLDRDKDLVVGVAFDSQGKRLVVGSMDGSLLLLDAETGRELRALPGHPDGITTAAFDSHGDVLASGGKDRAVRLWDVASGRELVCLRGHDREIETVAFVPGRPRGEWRLVSGDEAGMVKVWDAASCQGFAVLGGHDSLVRYVTFSSDGRRLASSGGDGQVKIWDAVAHKLLRQFPCQAEKLAFSPDGQWLTTAGANAGDLNQPGQVQLWKVEGENEPRTLYSEKHEPIMSVAFSPDGRRVAIVRGNPKRDPLGNRPLVTVGVDSGRVEVTYEADLGVGTAVAYSADGRWLAAAGWNGQVQVFDAEGGKPLRSLSTPEGDAVVSMALAPEGGLATGDLRGTIRLWDADSTKPRRTIRAHPGAVFGLSFGEKGHRLASASTAILAGRSEVKLWDADSGEELLSLPGSNTVCFSPVGRRLAAPRAANLFGSFEVLLWEVSVGEDFTARSESPARGLAVDPKGRTLISTHEDGTVRFWDSSTGRPGRVLRDHAGTVFGAAFSPDGTRVASAGNDRHVRLYDPESGQVLRTLSGHTQLVFGVSFSPQGNLLASASVDRTVRLWDAATGEPGPILEGPTDSLIRVAFSPDGTQVAAGCRNGAVYVWDVTTGEMLTSFTAHEGPAPALAFHPTGRWLVTGGADGAVVVWDATTGQRVRGFSGHARGVLAVAFSPDGRQLASGGHDQKVKVWNFANSELLHELRGHRHAVWGLVFSPGNTRLYSASPDGTVKAWDMPADIEAKPPHR